MQWVGRIYVKDCLSSNQTMKFQLYSNHKAHKSLCVCCLTKQPENLHFLIHMISSLLNQRHPYQRMVKMSSSLSCMSLLLLQVVCFLTSPWLLLSISSMDHQLPQQYVVYMGSSNLANGDGGADEAGESVYIQFLSSVIPRNESGRISLVHRYNHAFKGFSAMLTKNEASMLSGRDGVVSVFPDPILQLHTTRSWDFLEAQSVNGSTNWHQSHGSTSDVIIGVIDTGIWPESPSFNDEGIGEIPSRWRGVCMEGPDFKKSNCNRKLIGARYYATTGQTPHDNAEIHGDRRPARGSPRDHVGHGTHTTSIAAGARVSNASYDGLARGTARGGSPSSRLAIYKACTIDGCSGSVLLKAMDDAIADGVDIISVSIGATSLLRSDYLRDPIAIGAFHAEQKGVLVVCSGGNDGPDSYSVDNFAPWIFTVAASTIDRGFTAPVVLGNGKIFQGSAINFSNLTRSRTYPLVFGADAASEFAPAWDASNCYPGSLNTSKVAGKFVVCLNNDPRISRNIKKLVVEDAKAKGLILVSEEDRGSLLDSGPFPSSEIKNILQGRRFLSYINDTKEATATILATVDVPHYKPAPVVAYFSSRGPGMLTENILKPDIMAPGVSILAATIPEDGTVGGGKHGIYAIASGTSMACPHVAGAAALVKSVHSNWSSSLIKSAIMTTATIYDNLRRPFTNSSHLLASPHETGVGEINPVNALNPGLLFEMTSQDHLRFLCFYGYPDKIIRSMSKNFTCPKVRSEELISNINYPSISVGRLDRRHEAGRSIRRVVTNAGAPNSTYQSRVHAPKGLVVKVLPETMIFSEQRTRLPFRVLFHAKEATQGYQFGYLTWSNAMHSVRVVFAVNVV